jgi:hypothetical protein
MLTNPEKCHSNLTAARVVRGRLRDDRNDDGLPAHARRLGLPAQARTLNLELPPADVNSRLL